MSNLFGPPDADPAGHEPTQPLWAGSGDPVAAQGWDALPGPGVAGHQAPGLPEQPKNHRKALHWTAGLLAAVLLAGGGTIAGMRLAGHSPAATSGGASSGPAGPATSAQEGALLNETLNDASVPGALTAAGAMLTGGAGAAAGGQAGPATKAACAHARRASRAARWTGRPRLGRWLGAGAAHCRRTRRRVFAFFLLRGVDGQFTVQTRKGTKTLAFERGVIQSVSAGTSITVKASDGTTWTWALVAATVVRDRQGRVSQGKLTTGAPVWVGGPVVQGTKDARLIVVRPPQPGPVSPSSTPGN